MGTMLQRAGLPIGVLPELYTLEHPEILENIHRAYIEAGSRMAYTNTFSTNAHKLLGSGHTVNEVVFASVSAAKRAAAGKAHVALDIGPIGEMLEPSGTLSFEDAYALFVEILVAGEKAGADIIAFETFSDLAELRVAVLAAKENTALPIFATMSFEESGRTFTGCLAETFALTMTGLGVDALGVNCSMGPKSLMPIIRRIGAVSPLPLIVKANAGLPDARNGQYSITAEEFAEEMAECAEIGVRFVGGCCGTDPEFIKFLRNKMFGLKRAAPSISDNTYLCSMTKLVTVDSVRVIGERINPTGKKRFQQALRENDLDYVLAQGVAQSDAGAEILDVNVGVPGLDEAPLMARCVKGLQSVIDLPLQIDSNDPAAVEAGLRAFCGKAIVNSVNGQTEKLEEILPLVKKYGAAVVGLTMDEHGIPETAEARFAIAERILRACQDVGILKKDVFIDCLTLSVSASQNSANETLKAVRLVNQKLGLHTVLGVSNISFGLPNRELVGSTFLSLAMENGLDLPIMNPNSTSMMDAVAAFKLLRGFDDGCQNFIGRFADQKALHAALPTVSGDIVEAIAKGLKTETRELTRDLLTKNTALEIINTYLIPALDAVGERYERGEVFLPQLMRSADAACEAFELLKTSILSKGGASLSKGKIILATVKGDIHDIGKNIVKTLLANYGYQILDLGRDVSPQRVVETAILENVPLVGLSALMTTTLPAMVDTVRALHASGHVCKIMVGGAVLTPEYATEIHADYYARDAKQAVDIAKEVFGQE